MKLLIKGMVCDRCIYILSEELPKLGLEISDIRLGEVILKVRDKILEEQVIKTMLQKYGFDLLYNKDQRLISQIKSAVEKGIQKQLDTGERIKFSTLIRDELRKDYDSLSALFSSSEGLTLEKFIISRKIEKVKELLFYTQLSLSEIAYSLGYSSPAHLSNQLKKYTGFTSSHYKRMKRNKLAIIEEQSKNKNQV
ncbi:helix-turn-helix domain-containing protein [Sphingobacterium anhuiense]|uniref:Helix-turn-helix domain-containing protein n=1 Tax=Sphingobacterium anhuiense TaxID=493780 RepID=A0ABW5YYX8_9SPHI